MASKQPYKLRVLDRRKVRVRFPVGPLIAYRPGWARLSHKQNVVWFKSIVRDHGWRGVIPEGRHGEQTT